MLAKQLAQKIGIDHIVIPNVCGHKHKGLTLSDRLFICPECGHEEDRDLNAAKNILRQGIVEYLSSCKTTVSAVADCA